MNRFPKVWLFVTLIVSSLPLEHLGAQAGQGIRLVGYWPYAQNAVRVSVSGRYAYVTATDKKLHIIDILDPSRPTEVAFFPTAGFARGIATVGAYAYLVDGTSLYVLDISNPRMPGLIGGYSSPGFQPWDLTIVGRYAYVIDAYGLPGLSVIDVSIPSSPWRVGFVPLPGSAWTVAVSGNYAYVANFLAGLMIVDISIPPSPRLVGTYDTSHYAYGVAVSGNHAYVADAYGGLLVIDISNPYIPRLVGSEPTPGLAWHVVVSGTLAFVASGVAGGLAIFDISNPARPVLVASQDTPGSAYGIFLANTLIFIADLDGGLLILEYLDALPNLGLELNHRAFGLGQELTLAANVIPGLMPVMADVYVAVQLPDGSLLFLQGDGSFTTEIRPIVTGWSVAPFSGEIFRYTFSGGEPAGNYTWLAAFTQPGTLSFVGPIVSAPFSFSQ